MLKLPARQRLPRRKHGGRVCQAHRAWVRRHHCSVPECRMLPIECAHVRMGTDGATGLKPSDRWTISLCRQHHTEQHQIGETSFATKYGLDLIELAMAFADCSPHKAQLRLPPV